MTYIFTCERLGFRSFTIHDLKACSTIWGDEEVMVHCGGSTEPELLPNVIDFYQHCQEEMGLSVYAVVLLETNNVIGAVGFNIEKIGEEAELIFHFAKDAWGKGFATEAVNACITYAKGKNSIKKITASASLENLQSFRVLEKAGFDYVGIKYFEDTDQDEAFFELLI